MNKSISSPGFMGLNNNPNNGPISNYGGPSGNEEWAAAPVPAGDQSKGFGGGETSVFATSTLAVATAFGFMGKRTPSSSGLSAFGSMNRMHGMNTMGGTSDIGRTCSAREMHGMSRPMNDMVGGGGDNAQFELTRRAAPRAASERPRDFVGHVIAFPTKDEDVSDDDSDTSEVTLYTYRMERMREMYMQELMKQYGHPASMYGNSMGANMNEKNAVGLGPGASAGAGMGYNGMNSNRMAGGMGMAGVMGMGGKKCMSMSAINRNVNLRAHMSRNRLEEVDEEHGDAPEKGNEEFKLQPSIQQQTKPYLPNSKRGADGLAFDPRSLLSQQQQQGRSKGAGLVFDPRTIRNEQPQQSARGAAGLAFDPKSLLTQGKGAGLAFDPKSVQHNGKGAGLVFDPKSLQNQPNLPKVGSSNIIMTKLEQAREAEKRRLEEEAQKPREPVVQEGDDKISGNASGVATANGNRNGNEEDASRVQRAIGGFLKPLLQKEEGSSKKQPSWFQRNTSSNELSSGTSSNVTGNNINLDAEAVGGGTGVSNLRRSWFSDAGDAENDNVTSKTSISKNRKFWFADELDVVDNKNKSNEDYGGVGIRNGNMDSSKNSRTKSNDNDTYKSGYDSHHDNHLVNSLIDLKLELAQKQTLLDELSSKCGRQSKLLVKKELNTQKLQAENDRLQKENEELRRMLGMKINPVTHYSTPDLDNTGYEHNASVCLEEKKEVDSQTQGPTKNPNPHRRRSRCSLESTLEGVPEEILEAYEEVYEGEESTERKQDEEDTFVASVDVDGVARIGGKADVACEREFLRDLQGLDEEVDYDEDDVQDEPTFVTETEDEPLDISVSMRNDVTLFRDLDEINAKTNRQVVQS
mmetsp:Transcript_17936/g.37618  ORF Transcript_17936/g.37618 Transcript_17936/m.37618 type:complete len:861 (-) Transcript_17936:115-2697(-)|eukprot:CAMPEP_0171338078 /NCGR_PEP_ID=MMETSP0878-20121228/7092_1 /TAXON_ID=67004 /ORGANISM="Thalassiosira weissflogii, Strain CCMP1336" /LENGTH=860 /DNA_ID=CAMNT_0011839791 /DNA_START=50 /DNA_END=2632 /DNA_ORIENTATION=+